MCFIFYTDQEWEVLVEFSGRFLEEGSDGRTKTWKSAEVPPATMPDFASSLQNDAV